MDIFSHGLWASAIAKGANIQKKKPLNPWLAAWWGVFPDLFAFTIPFLYLLYGLGTGRITRSAFPGPEHLEPVAQQSGIFGLAHQLYNYSHSLVIFTVVILVVVACQRLRHRDKRLVALIPWEMGGWMLHILADIPTHTYRFYPTPVFWPIWGWKFNGFSWAQPWFLVLDYGLLVAFSIGIYLLKRRQAQR